MASHASPDQTFRNVILSRLSEQERATLKPHLTPMDLPRDLELLSPNSSTDWVYFIERGLASVSASTRDGKAVEIGLIAREGVLGVSSLLGHPPMSQFVVMQSAGHGFRLRTSVLRKEMLKSATLLQSVHDATYMQMCSFAQSGVCNGMHEVEARLSRCLLTASDLMETDTMDFTQEFLGLMLGTQRTSVSVAAGTLQRSGLVSYQRGHLTILNRPMLEDAACECYTILREVYQRTFPDKTAR